MTYDLSGAFIPGQKTLRRRGGSEGFPASSAKQQMTNCSSCIEAFLSVSTKPNQKWSDVYKHIVKSIFCKKSLQNDIPSVFSFRNIYIWEIQSNNDGIFLKNELNDDRLR